MPNTSSRAATRMNISFGEQPPLFWAGIAEAGDPTAICSANRRAYKYQKSDESQTLEYFQ